MKTLITYKTIYISLLSVFCYSLTTLQAQNGSHEKANYSETNKRASNYEKLKDLGYSEKEIFEDLGNANFLLERYETAVFWYKKLKKISNNKSLSNSYSKRYQYALEQTSGISNLSDISDNKKWLEQIVADYQTDKQPYKTNKERSYATKYNEVNFQQKRNEFLDVELLTELGIKPADTKILNGENEYKAPIAFSPDGATAYFSKAVYEKPLKGIFSKKELVHKVYKADKINGKWSNLQEVALSPNHYSALHPAISNDGKRLFFASNMPGSYGEYDIYVSTIKKDGSIGIAKNLGSKVNTKKNDLYPSFVGGNTLVFASEGHNGHGGLDVYMAQIGKREVGLAVNLGNKINSAEDDFSIYLMKENGVGYVMSNRGKDTNTIERVAFSVANSSKRTNNKRDFNLLDAYTSNSKTSYAASSFDDE